MATSARELSKKTKSSTTTNEVLIVQNTETDKASQFPLDDVFPMLQDGATTSASKTLGAALATTVTTPLFVGGGFGSSITGSDKNTLIFKGVRSNSSILQIKNETLSADPTKGNIVWDFDETGIDLSNCDNTSSGFLSSVDLTSNVTGTLPVANGGTGATALTDGGVCLTQISGTDAIRTLAMKGSGQMLIGGASGPTVTTLTAGSNITITNGDGTVEISSSLGTISSTLDLNNNSIDLGTGWLSNDGTNQGLKLDASGNIFVGPNLPTQYFDQALNVSGSIALGNATGSTNVSLAMKSTTTGPTSSLSILGADASGTGNAGGNVTIEAGDGDTNANGGTLTLSAGLKSGSGTDGNVLIKTGGTTAITVDDSQDTTFAGAVTVTSGNVGLTSGDVTVSAGDVNIVSSANGLDMAGGLVTQTTNFTTGVTLDARQGRIRLENTATLAGHAHATFTVTNSTVAGSSSLVFLTMNDNTSSGLFAIVSNIATGSFDVDVINATSTTSTAGTHIVQFMVVNP